MSGRLRSSTYCRWFTSLCLLAGTGCRHAHHEEAGPEKYLVTSPHRTDTELTRAYVAQIRAIQHIEVRSIEKGYLQGTFVDEGQRVEKGARMFQITPLIYQAEAEKAGAEASMMEIELNNTKLLADKQVVSPNELALAKAKFAKSKAEVSLATTHRSFTDLRAPFSGIMGRFNVRMGSLLDEGDLLTTLSDNSKVWVYFNLSETEYLDYKARPDADKPPQVKLVLANGQLFDQAGLVETIESDFDADTGTVAFRAVFPNPNGLLRHGETGKILMVVPLKNALLIPQKATFDVLDKKFVFVVDDKHVVHSRPITISAEMPQLFAVAGGLAESDRILVEGLRKVKEGATIVEDFKPASEVLAHLEVRAE